MYLEKDTNTVKSDSEDLVVQAIIEAVQAWREYKSISNFVVSRHGFGGDWFGISYLNDFDGWDIWRKGHFIPESYVHVDVNPGSDVFEDEFLYPEEKYIDIVINIMDLKGFEVEVARLKKFKETILPDIQKKRVRNDFLTKEWDSFVLNLKKEGWREVDQYIICKRNEAKFRLSASYDLDSLRSLIGSKPHLEFEFDFVRAYDLLKH